MIDETRNLVKVIDKDISKDPIFFIASSDNFVYDSQPPQSKYYVNFTYKASDSNIFVSYLQSNINWRTQYHLNLYENNKCDLIAMANIRNDGKLAIKINQAELIGGDINLQIQQQYERSYRSFAYNSNSNMQAQQIQMEKSAEATADVSVEQGKELAGLYIFSINKPFTINAKTNYLLSMFQPQISLERYGLISKIFSSNSATGKAQRSYCLKADRYLSQGNCLIRESDRIVGETQLPNLAAKDKYDFSIGEDADIVYKENVTLVSSKTFNETATAIKTLDGKNVSPVVFITRTQLVYNIDVKLKNFKMRPVKIQYEQKGFYSYQTFELTKATKYEFIRDGSSIKTNMTLKANTTEKFSYTLMLVR
jgi:hypothetical protein